jgi:hypothetical protein
VRHRISYGVVSPFEVAGDKQTIFPSPLRSRHYHCGGVNRPPPPSIATLPATIPNRGEESIGRGRGVRSQGRRCRTVETQEARPPSSSSSSSRRTVSVTSSASARRSSPPPPDPIALLPPSRPTAAPVGPFPRGRRPHTVHIDVKKRGCQIDHLSFSIKHHFAEARISLPGIAFGEA